MKINLNYLLLRPEEHKHFTVMAGSTYYAKPGDVINISRVDIHPHFDESKFDLDAAVLTLARKPVTSLSIIVSNFKYCPCYWNNSYNNRFHRFHHWLQVSSVALWDFKTNNTFKNLKVPLKMHEADKAGETFGSMEDLYSQHTRCLKTLKFKDKYKYQSFQSNFFLIFEKIL